MRTSSNGYVASVRAPRLMRPRPPAATSQVVTSAAAPPRTAIAMARRCPTSTTSRLPRVTPKPRIDGVQSAIVTGEAGQEIHTDTLGRVHLVFPWDVRGPKDHRSSVAVRVMQPEAPAAKNQ